MTDNRPDHPPAPERISDTGAREDQPSALGPARRSSRRVAFKAGLAALPLVLTLPSRSAWGQGGGPNGTNVTPISAAQQQGMSEEQIQQLRLQLQQAEQSSGGSGWDEDAGGGSDD